MSVTDGRVAIVETGDRSYGVNQSIDSLNINPVKGKNVLIKPNFNTADPAPGSTHNETLVALVKKLWDMGATSIRLGERSFPPTQQVLAQKGVVPLLEPLDVQIIDFDTLKTGDWVKVNPEGSQWRDGFRIARPILETECLVSTGCLKTHQFGGVFTLSLKLHVGTVPTTRHGFDYMNELHMSPLQQQLIAEINAPFAPSLVVMDGVDTFVDGGPATGKRVNGNVFLAATDRVAVDAVGVAVLKALGSNPTIMNTKIFDHPQLARAAEIGLGVTSAADIHLVAVDDASRSRVEKVAAQLY